MLLGDQIEVVVWSESGQELHKLTFVKHSDG